MLAVSWDTIRLFLHVLAATIWVGGQLVLAALVPVLRKGGVAAEAARRFNQVAWVAFAVLVATGIWNVAAVGHMSPSYRTTLIVKLVVVAISGVTAALHIRSRTARSRAVFGALTGLSALGALFLGVLLAGLTSSAKRRRVGQRDRRRGGAAMCDDPFPVEWTGRQAVVAFPGRVDISNVDQLRDRLLAVINRGAAVLIADMTGTASCDHAGVEAMARACQRAAISGTQVRLVVTAPGVRRVLAIESLDRMVPIYPSLEAAMAAGHEPGWPAGNNAMVSAATVRSVTPAVLWQLIDALGDGLLLVSHDGKIVLVNRRCAEMFGYPREELTGLPVDALVPSGVRAVHQDYRAGYHREPEIRPMAERARLVALRKDGATLPVEITLSPVPTASETFVLAVVRDATEPGRRHDLLDLAQGAVAEQPQVTRDLLDRVVNRLFQVGLSVQAASGLPGDVARKRLAEALDQLDDAIQEIRNYAFGHPASLGTGWSAS